LRVSRKAVEAHVDVLAAAGRLHRTDDDGTAYYTTD
jgi:hypothetical protein